MIETLDVNLSLPTISDFVKFLNKKKVLLPIATIHSRWVKRFSRYVKK